MPLEKEPHRSVAGEGEGTTFIMPGDTCVVCGNTRGKDPNVSFHRFPTDPARREVWLRVFQLEQSQVKAHFRVCSRHFPAGDAKKAPQLNLGKRFASPMKKSTSRAKRAKTREASKEFLELQTPSPSSSRSATPAPVTLCTSSSISATPDASEPALRVAVGEQLETDYQVHELPSDSSEYTSEPLLQPTPASQSTEVVVNTALLTRVEALEAENHRLNKQLKEVTSKQQHFRIEQIRHDDTLVRFYTGFMSYMIFQAFFVFLGQLLMNSTTGVPRNAPIPDAVSVS